MARQLYQVLSLVSLNLKLRFCLKNTSSVFQYLSLYLSGDDCPQQPLILSSVYYTHLGALTRFYL